MGVASVVPLSAVRQTWVGLQRAVPDQLCRNQGAVRDRDHLIVLPGHDQGDGSLSQVLREVQAFDGQNLVRKDRRRHWRFDPSALQARHAGTLSPKWWRYPSHYHLRPPWRVVEIGDGGRVRWVSGAPGRPPEHARTDFIVARDGKTAALYLFLDELPSGQPRAEALRVCPRWPASLSLSTARGAMREFDS